MTVPIRKAEPLALQDHLRVTIAETEQALDSLQPLVEALQAELYAATTYRDIATADDYAAGHAKRSAVWTDLGPLMDQQAVLARTKFRAQKRLAAIQKPRRTMAQSVTRETI